ncbi:hypothetical protein NDU88_008708 [Pleurodeles waltl]|uniref:Uncharacterized protein n=1 Tax=Pleurodeles waltl TaxID=8319 RepID=A0AAV7RYE3_PLEWA|nr:hypothetical protein NDU88_008708 [Pleurodeles waltl]
MHECRKKAAAGIGRALHAESPVRKEASPEEDKKLPGTCLRRQDNHNSLIAEANRRGAAAYTGRPPAGCFIPPRSQRSGLSQGASGPITSDEPEEEKIRED